MATARPMLSRTPISRAPHLTPAGRTRRMTLVRFGPGHPRPLLDAARRDAIVILRVGAAFCHTAAMQIGSIDNHPNAFGVRLKAVVTLMRPL